MEYHITTDELFLLVLVFRKLGAGKEKARLKELLLRLGVKRRTLKG